MRYHFADCVLDTESFQLQRAGRNISIEPQVFDLIKLLAENAGALVTKDKMVDVVWGGRIVSEATISARISAARMAVGDTGKSQAIIKTIPRRGIEMVADVKQGEAAICPEMHVKVKQTIRFTTSRDGTQLAFAVSGDGTKIMRAGHFLTHLEKDWASPVWGPYLEKLSTQHTLVRYDQRGTGLSDPTLRGMDVEDYAADLLAVADAAGLEKFPLIASSQGVPTSIFFAANYPERISHLVLFGGFAQGRAKRDHAHADDEAKALLSLIRSGWGNPKSAFMVAFTSVFCPEASKDELDNLVDIQLASCSPDNAARIREAIDQFDVSEYLSRVKAPTLVIHASNDALHPVSQGRLIAGRIPGAEFLQVDSRNHVYLPSDPVWQQIVDAQLEFISAG